MAVPSYPEIMEKVQEGTLIDAIFNRHWGCTYSEYEPYTDTLARIHNEGALDLVEGVSEEFLSRYTDMRRVIGKMVYARLLGKLNVDLPALLDVIERLYEPVADRSDVSHVFETWCYDRSDRVDEIFKSVDEMDERCERFEALKAAISQGVRSNTGYHAPRAFAYLNNPNQSLRDQALDGLRYARHDEDENWLSAINALRAIAETDRSDSFRAALLRTIFCWLEKAPKLVYVALHDLASEILFPVTAAVTKEIAYTLAHRSSSLTPPLWQSLLKALGGATLQPYDCSNLDLFLKRLIDAGGANHAQEFLQNLFLTDQSEHSFSEFVITVQGLLNGKPDVLNSWVIRWLRSGNQRLCTELHKGFLLGQEQPHQFVSEESSFNLRPEEYGFISRKAVGHFFAHPIPLATILVLLGTSAPSAQRAEIIDLLYDPVLINYPSLAQGCLAPMANGDGSAAEMISAAITRLNSYMNGIDKARALKELLPPAHHRQMEFERYTDQVQQAIDEGKKGSFLADIFVERTLLYGNGLISLRPADSNYNTVETKATPFHHNLEVARQYFFAPISLRKQLVLYQMECHS
ncbi:hypothetical protein [Pseudomonas capeferrum]|uniref:hypothetical protein n=1 Tax=Pseudomonas capeferrum TaxID=1495066 RepID=UPI0030D95E7A